MLATLDADVAGQTNSRLLLLLPYGIAPAAALGFFAHPVVSTMAPRCQAAVHEAMERKAAAMERKAAARLFAVFDVDTDGKLSKDEYKAYLQGIGHWDSVGLTDASYDASGWAQECEALEGSTADGIGWEGFEGILYGTHRWGKAEADLEQCKHNA